MDARGVVVGARRRAGRGQPGQRGAAVSTVDAIDGRAALWGDWRLSLPARVGQRRGELMHPIAQWRGRRQRASDRVIGCRHLDAIDVRLGVSVRPTPIWMPGVLSLVLGAVLVGQPGRQARRRCLPSVAGPRFGAFVCRPRRSRRRGELMHPIAQWRGHVSVPVTGS